MRIKAKMIREKKDLARFFYKKFKIDFDDS